MQLTEKWKRFLSLPATSVFIILLSISGRVIQKLSFAGLDDDKCYQVQATKNLLAGHGISTYEVVADNLSTPQYTPLIKWPPGYSILLSPFQAASGNDYLWGTAWLDIIASILFVILARKIIQQFNVPVWLANLYTLVAGFFLYDFVSTNSTDLLTLVCFQAAFLFTVRFFNSRGNRFSDSLWIAFFLCCCALLRYMFVPVVAVIPAYLIITGLLNKNRVYIRRGLFIFSTLIIIIGGLLLFQKINSGSATYVAPSEKGIYPGNLLHTVPFLYAAAGNLGPPAMAIQKASGVDYTIISDIIVYSHLVLLVILLFVFLGWITRNKFRVQEPWLHYIYITLLSSMAVVATLALLSLRYEKFRLISGLTWTYVTEPRYFAVPIFFLQLFLILAVYRAYKNKKWARTWAFLALLPLGLSTLHGMYFTTKRIVGKEKVFLNKPELQTLESSRRFFHQFVTANPGKKIVCVSGDPMFNNFAALWENIPGLYEYQKLNSGELVTKEPVLLFIPVKSWYAHKLEAFLANPGKKWIGQVGDWQFYSMELHPAIK